MLFTLNPEKQLWPTSNSPAPTHSTPEIGIFPSSYTRVPYNLAPHRKLNKTPGAPTLAVRPSGRLRSCGYATRA
jgi:hypothetical protein